MLPDSSVPVDIGDLITACLVHGHIRDRTNPNVVAARANLGASATRLIRHAVRKQSLHVRSARWTAEEDAFLRKVWGVLTEEEIGRALGRTEAAVHIHSERTLGLPRPTKNPNLLTTRAC